MLEAIGVSLPPALLAFMDEHAYGYSPERTGELARRLPDPLVDAFSLAGTPAQLIERLRGIEALGIDHAAFWLFPPRGESMESTLERLCTQVVPAFR